MRLPRRFLPLFLPTVLSSLVLAAPQQPGDETLNAAARELADKVVAALASLPDHNPAIKFGAGNRSSILPSVFDGGVKEFQAELQRRGVHTSQSPVPEVGLVLTENLQNYLWVAWIALQGRDQTLMTSIPRGAVAPKPLPGPQMVLQEQFIVSRPEPILDLLFYKLPETGERRLLVLQQDQLLILQSENSSWKPDASAVLQHDAPWPRDLRGRIEELLFPDRLEAFFPDAVCDVRRDPSWQASCSVKSIQFPVFSGLDFEQMAQFIPQRNYFGNSQVDANKQAGVLPAYTTAFVGWGTGKTYAVSTQLDGRAALFENLDYSEPVATIGGWGSDIVSQNTDCGQKWQLLVTRTGDWTEADAIQAFEIVDRQTVAVSGLVDFPGPVTALWAAPGAQSAVAVVRNLKTGFYEAYGLSIACGH